MLSRETDSGPYCNLTDRRVPIRLIQDMMYNLEAAKLLVSFLRQNQELFIKVKQASADLLEDEFTTKANKMFDIICKILTMYCTGVNRCRK